eukprot:scaffold13524_cov109-Isochrysis_galbana.AAC.15
MTATGGSEPKHPLDQIAGFQGLAHAQEVAQVGRAQQAEQIDQHLLRQLLQRGAPAAPGCVPPSRLRCHSFAAALTAFTRTRGQRRGYLA